VTRSAEASQGSKIAAPDPPEAAVVYAQRREQRVLSGASYSQTLSRGLALLEVLSELGRSASLQELAQALDVHRSVAYRLVRTLEGHRLVRVERDGRYAPGLGLVTLARTAAGDVRTLALPILGGLAQELAATTFLATVDSEEVVCLASVQPPQAMIAVHFQEGLRHSLRAGAAGLAILAGRPPTTYEREAVSMARTRGYAVSRGEIESGATGISAPIIIPGQPVTYSITAVFLDGQVDDERRIAAAVRSAAERLGALMC
jgi:DNA-binding IclR family transcriptional regulator